MDEGAGVSVKGMGAASVDASNGRPCVVTCMLFIVRKLPGGGRVECEFGV